MGNCKKRATKEELSSQKRRTYRNQIKRLRNLLVMYPSSPDVSKWEADLDFYIKNQ
jgi:hypothetical protein